MNCGREMLKFERKLKLLIEIFFKKKKKKKIFSQSGDFIRSFGSEGSRAGQFKRPMSAFVDERGFIYVVDGKNDRIQVRMHDI